MSLQGDMHHRMRSCKVRVCTTHLCQYANFYGVMRLSLIPSKSLFSTTCIPFCLLDPLSLITLPRYSHIVLPYHDFRYFHWTSNWAPSEYASGEPRIRWFQITNERHLWPRIEPGRWGYQSASASSSRFQWKHSRCKILICFDIHSLWGLGLSKNPFMIQAASFLWNWFNILQVDSQPSDDDSAIGGFSQTSMITRLSHNFEHQLTSSSTSISSVRSNTYNFVEENGRTYHGFKEGSKCMFSMVLYFC